MLLAIGVLTILVLLFALLAVTPLMPEVGPAETALSESQAQPVVSFPTDQAQAA
jgi:type II secretory pathway component PulM